MGDLLIKGIMFDLDGTLGDTLPLCIVSFQKTLEVITGRKYTKEEVIRHFGKTEEGILQSLVPDKWEKAFDTYLEIYNKNHHICSDVFDRYF